MQEKLEGKEVEKRLVFSDEATFHTNSKVNEHNVRICGGWCGGIRKSPCHILNDVVTQILNDVNFFGGGAPCIYSLKCQCDTDYIGRTTQIGNEYKAMLWLVFDRPSVIIDIDA